MSLFRHRQVRPSRFSSRLRHSSRQRREYAASVYSMALIQFLLAGSFALAAVRSFQAIQAHGGAVPLAARLVMPVAFLGAAVFSLRAAVGNARGARELWRSRHRNEAETRPEESPPRR